jgi:hypothetical protein
VDGLVLFFSSKPFGKSDDWDLYMTTRTTVEGAWTIPVGLGQSINTTYDDAGPFLAPDNSALFFNSGRSGGLGSYDIWQVPITPILDFNGDGAVDCLDICDLVEHWGTSDSLYDIGPIPWGDGMVAAQDLLVLAESLAQNPLDASDAGDR